MTQRRKKKVGMKTERDGIPVRNYLPSDLPIYHVDNMNIVHVQGNFYLSFLQVQMPLIADDSEFVKLKEIPSKCVVRVLMNEATLSSLVETLDKHLKKVRAKAKAAE